MSIRDTNVDLIDDPNNNTVETLLDKNDIKSIENDFDLNSFEDVDEESSITCVSHIIGEFGPWQRRFFVYYSIIYILNVFHNTGIVYYSALSDFWCRDRVQPNMTNEQWNAIRNKCFDDCSGYDVDRSTYKRTIYSEFELVCSRSWLVSASSSAYQIGYLISSLLVCYLSDRHGRKLTFKCVILIDILACGVQAIAPNIEVFIIAQIILGISAYGRFLTGLLLIQETAGPKKKAILQVWVEVFWSFGMFGFLILFYLLSDFRYVKFFACCYELSGVLFFPIVPESIRWLLSKGRYDEAKELLLHAISYNQKYGQPKSDGLSDQNKKCSVEMEEKINKLLEHFRDQEIVLKEHRRKNLLNLWMSPMFTVCVCLYLCWYTNSLIGYATTYNQSNFGSNLYMSSVIFEIAHLFAYGFLMFNIERFNRRHFGRFAYIILFFTCVSLSLSFYFEGRALGYTLREAPKHAKINYLRLALGMLLKFAGSMCYNIVYLLSVESFPTIMRQLGVGTCSVVSRFASISAPFTKELASLIGLPYLFAFFASLALVALTSMTFIVETRGKEIPNTLHDCLVRKQKAIDKRKSRIQNK